MIFFSILVEGVFEQIYQSIGKWLGYNFVIAVSQCLWHSNEKSTENYKMSHALVFGQWSANENKSNCSRDKNTEVIEWIIGNTRKCKITNDLYQWHSE